MSIETSSIDTDVQQIDPRFQYLNISQLQTLCGVMNRKITVESTNLNMPTLLFPLFEFILELRKSLLSKKLECENFKLNGGAASYVISQDLIVKDDYNAGSSMSTHTENQLDTRQQRHRHSSISPTPSSTLPALTLTTSYPHQRFFNKSNYYRSVDTNYYLSSETRYSDFGDFNDFDIIISMNIDRWDDIKNCTLDTLRSFMPNVNHSTAFTLWEAYVTKHVCVLNENDRWCLITFCNHKGHNLELKFVQSIRRSYQFSIDSFHIHLDQLFNWVSESTLSKSDQEISCDSNGKSSKQSQDKKEYSELGKSQIKNESPALDKSQTNDESPALDKSQTLFNKFMHEGVLAESVYGDFRQAFYHLKHRLIVVRQPEEIRGGGLLRYCHLLVKGFKPADPMEMSILERYMCTRFQIDFYRADQRQQTITNYEKTHLRNTPEMIEHWYDCLQAVMNNNSTTFSPRNEQFNFAFYRYPKLNRHRQMLSSVPPQTYHYNNCPYQLTNSRREDDDDHSYHSYCLQSTHDHNYQDQYQQDSHHSYRYPQYSLRRSFHLGIHSRQSPEKSSYHYSDEDRSQISSPPPPPRPYNPQAFNIINNKRRSKLGAFFFQGGPPFLIESRGSD